MFNEILNRSYYTNTHDRRVVENALQIFQKIRFESIQCFAGCWQSVGQASQVLNTTILYYALKLQNGF